MILKYLITALTFLLFTIIVPAQSVVRYVTGNGGGSGQAGGYVLDFTIGEIMIGTAENAYTIITQGFQQSTLHVSNNRAVLKGEIINKNIVLNWITPTEVNSVDFMVERERDTLNVFGAMATFPSKAINGNSAVPLSYTWTDLQPLSPVTYYKIRLTAKNGTVTYSNTIAVVFNQLTWWLDYIYPNPVKSTSRIHIFAQENMRCTLMILDIFGRVLKTETAQLIKGNNTLDCSIGALPAGIYYVRLHCLTFDIKDLSAKIIKIN